MENEENGGEEEGEVEQNQREENRGQEVEVITRGTHENQEGFGPGMSCTHDLSSQFSDSF